MFSYVCKPITKQHKTMTNFFTAIFGGNSSSKVSEYEAQVTRLQQEVEAAEARAAQAQAQVSAPVDSVGGASAPVMLNGVSINVLNKNQLMQPDEFNQIYVEGEMSFADVARDLFGSTSLEGATLVTVTSSTGIVTSYNLDDDVVELEGGDILAITRTAGRGA